MNNDQLFEQFLNSRSQSNIRNTNHSFSNLHEKMSSIRMKNIFELKKTPVFMRSQPQHSNKNIKRIIRGNLLEKKHFLYELMGSVFILYIYI